MAKVFEIGMPQGAPGCVVADSPHSGTDYPPDFGHAAPLHELKKAEDTGIDRLYGFFPARGVPFLQAQFPRSYVDPNRADDVSARYLKHGDGDYEGTDTGLVRQKCTPRSAERVYDRKLKLSEVFNRVAAYHRPYHEKLKEMLDDAHARHGKVVHVNCHSMPSVLRAGTAKNAHDVIIGTQGGRTCAPHVADRLRRLFEAKGYKVGMDVPGFRGAEIVRRSGDPAHNRHSLQLEINRALYMDEDTLALKPEMAGLQKDLQDIMRDFTDFCDALPPVPSPPAAAQPRRAAP